MTTTHCQLLFVWGTDAARHLCKTMADIWSLVLHALTCMLQHHLNRLLSQVTATEWSHDGLLQARRKEDLPEKEKKKHHHRRQHKGSEWTMLDLVAEEILTEGELGILDV
jgi:hypothetical protein